MDTQAATSIIRWIHMLAGAAWLGEVGAVVFVLSPVLVRLGSQRRGWFLSTVFPRIFRLASVPSATAVTAGALLFLATNDWRLDLGRLVDGRWGISILIGGPWASPS